jgi:hypothetical protein
VKVHVYLTGHNPVHDAVLTAFYQGVDLSTGNTVQLLDVHKPLPCDVAVVFGIRKEKVPISYPRGEVIRRQREAGKPVVVLETGYVKRGDGPEAYYAAGLNGLNGRADFRNKGRASDRWDQLGVSLTPWSQHGIHILVCGQVPWDASVQHIDYCGWVRQTIAKLNAYTSRHIVFRPHPMAANFNFGPLHGAQISPPGRPFEEDLRGCHTVVTFNSNAAVDAVIAGIPAIAMDPGSMAWDVTEHDLSRIEFPIKPDRDQWAANLAYSQWTQQEMAQGWAWAHLFRP